MQRFTFSLVFFLTGVVLTAWGVVAGRSSWIIRASAQRVDGVVKELIPVREASHYDSRSGRTIYGSTTFAPVVEYHAEGQTYRIQGQNSTSPPSYAVGNRVQVLVCPEKPSEGRIDSFGEVWQGPLALTGVGLFFGVIGVAALFGRRRAVPDQA